MKLTIEKDAHAVYHYIQTTQFKSLQMTLRFFDTLSEKKATTRHLMLMMLRAKNAAFPSRKVFNKHLEHLYDTSFRVQSLKLGHSHVNQITFGCVNPSFTEDMTYAQIGALLGTILYQPLFDEKSLEEEKRFLKDYFNAEYANKSRYAQKRYLEHLFKGHPHRVNPFGDERFIDNITLSDIEKAHQEMLSQNPVTVSIIGDFDRDALAEALPFSFKDNAPLPSELFVRRSFDRKESVKETLPLAQDRLFMTYDSDIYYGDRLYFPMIVLSTMLGEGSDSLLFRRIREEDGLAYYIFARYMAMSGLISIQSAMRGENVEYAKRRIQDTVEEVKDGAIDQKQLRLAKKQLTGAIKQSFDSPATLTLYALRHTLFDVPFDEDYYLSRIERVEEKDVHEAAKRLEHVFTFILGSDDHA